MTDEANKENYSWRAHPARQYPRRTAGAIFIILIIIGLVQFSFQSIIWSGFSLIIMILALNRYFFSSSYSINPDSISAHYFLGKKHFYWKNIRRFNYDANGGYLSTRKRRSNLDAYRGMHLYFNEQREDIIHRIKQKMENSTL